MVGGRRSSGLPGDFLVSGALGRRTLRTEQRAKASANPVTGQMVFGPKLLTDMYEPNPPGFGSETKIPPRVGSLFSMESLILAQDERWRRA